MVPCGAQRHLQLGPSKLTSELANDSLSVIDQSMHRGIPCPCPVISCKRKLREIKRAIDTKTRTSRRLESLINPIHFHGVLSAAGRSVGRHQRGGVLPSPPSAPLCRHSSLSPNTHGLCGWVHVDRRVCIQVKRMR